MGNRLAAALSLSLILQGSSLGQAAPSPGKRVMKRFWNCPRTADDASVTSGDSVESSQTSVSEEEILRNFPQVQNFWRGGSYLLLGSGIRYYRLGFIDIKVYAQALYVEQQTAIAELARLKAAGFFNDGDVSVDRMCNAIEASKCNKVIQIQLLRSVTSSQFTGALAKSLKPRLADTDDKRFIPAFEAYFEKKSLCTGTNIPLMWTEGGQLELDLLAPGQADFQGITPSETVPSLRFSEALFDIYLSKDTPVSGAREQFAASVRRMLNLTTAVS